LEVNTIWIVVLGVVSIVVLISLTTDTFRNAAYRIYCSVYLTITRFFSNVEPSSIPPYCKTNGNVNIEVIKINDQDNTLVSRAILSYIITCWKDVEIRELYKTHTCYELHLLKTVNDVTEESVTNLLIKEDNCRSIENSDYKCGVMNQITWDVGDGTIKDQKIILIEYNQENDAIRVIG